MRKVKIIAGIAWAFICLVLILILFPGLNTFSGSVAKLPFMKINPNFTGGEVADRKVTGGCTLAIRKPVFDGLLKERNKGFVQLDWSGNLPVELYDTIDYDFDKIPDFTIHINRDKSTAFLNPISPKVINLNISTPTSNGWTIRVDLRK